MNTTIKIKQSPFTNTYGSLNLVKGDDGNFYLEMEDPQGDDLYGPLTDEQVEAFHLLCEVNRVY
jgi:hypothetical protein